MQLTNRVRIPSIPIVIRKLNLTPARVSLHIRASWSASDLIWRVMALVALLWCGAVAGRAGQPIVGWGNWFENGTYPVAHAPGDLTNAVAIATGGGHGVGLTRDGTVRVWGDDSCGQLSVPEGLSEVDAISAGHLYSLALRKDGTIVGWGWTNYGRFAMPTGLNGVVRISAGDSYGLALRDDGRVFSWGGEGEWTPLPGLRNVVGVSAGSSHGLALCVDGSVVAWGDNFAGKASVPAGLSNVVAIAAGGYHSLALRADGKVVGWGGLGVGWPEAQGGESNVVAQPSDLANVVGIAAGNEHSVALLANGTVVAWGVSGNGEAEAPAGLSNVVAVAAGWAHSFAMVGEGPPVVRLVPSRLAVASQAYLRSEAVGEWPLSYQWQCNGTNVPDATNAWLRVLPAQAGAYSVTVSNRLGTATSRTCLVEPEPLSFQTQPQSVSVGWGGAATFTVSVAGLGPFAYQWCFNGLELIGETNSILTVTNVRAAAVGDYSVRVTNPLSAAESNPAHLQVQLVAAWGARDPGLSAVLTGATNPIAIAGGAERGLVLRSDGTARAWGFSDNAAADSLCNLIAVAVGEAHALALHVDGSLTAWGSDLQGQCTLPKGLEGVVGIAAGGQHSLAVLANGTVVAWGANTHGQRDVPADLHDVISVAAGRDHSLALRADGSVIAWGARDKGQTDVPQGLSNVVAIAAGEAHSLALNDKGAIITWGSNEAGQTTVPAALIKAKAIAAGAGHSLAVQADGTVVGWGARSAGQTAVPEVLSDVVAVSGVGNGSLALIGAGSPSVRLTAVRHRALAGVDNVHLQVSAIGAPPLSYQWLLDGEPVPGATNRLLALSGLLPEQAGRYSVAVTNSLGTATSGECLVEVIPLQLISEPKSLVALAGGEAMFSVTAEGAGPLVYQWRFNGLDLPEETNSNLVLSNVQASAAGTYSVRVTNPFGTVESASARLLMAGVVAWGADTHGQAEVPTGQEEAVLVAAGGRHTLALWRDGTVHGWGDNDQGQATPPAGLEGVVAIAAGLEHSVALRTNGTVVAWGANNSGQTNVPIGLVHVVAIAAGDAHTLALRDDGSVVAWGANSVGQTNVPASLSQVVAIAAGGEHSLALRADGMAVGWGANTEGQCDIVAGPSPITMIAAGSRHSVALHADGTVTAYGTNDLGQTTVPLDLSNVVAIAAGGNHNLALRSDGTVTAWGELGVQAATPALAAVSAIACGSGHNVVIMGSREPWVRVPAFPRQLIALGGWTCLRGYAVGSPPLSYQWRRDGTPIPGATNLWLVIAGVLPEEAGWYSLTASDAAGHAVSASTGVDIVPLRITVAPQGQRVPAGSSTSFTVGVEGVPPFAYQWVRDGVQLTGQTNETLILSDLEKESAGSYSVRVANRYATLASTPAQLEVQTLLVWTSGNSEALAVPTNLTDAVAIASGAYQCLALRSNGEVASWGLDEYVMEAPPASLTNAVALAGGLAWATALMADGTLTAWGYGEGVDALPKGLAEVVAIGNGYSHSVALKADGTVMAWGDDHVGQTWVPQGLSNVTAIACGDMHTVALRADGTPIQWGFNGWDHIPMPVGITNLVAIAAGSQHSFALRADGTVVAWATAWPGILDIFPGINDVVAIAAGGGQCLALRANGTLATWGAPAAVPADLRNIAAIAGGVYHVLTLLGDGPPVVKPGLPHYLRFTQDQPIFLRVSATGKWPLSYRWRVNGADLPDATNNWVRLPQVAADRPLQVEAVVANRLGSVTNLVAVVSGPYFAGMPQIERLSLGEQGFRVAVTGLPLTTRCVLWTSPNLADWTPVVTNAPSASRLEYTAPFSPDRPGCFLRATIRP